MKRSPIKRGKPIKSKIKSVPKDIYQQVLDRDGGCVARSLIPDVRCVGRIDPHHALMKSQGGQDTLDDLIAVCRSHHDYIHANPAISYELGLLRHRQAND